MSVVLPCHAAAAEALDILFTPSASGTSERGTVLGAIDALGRFMLERPLDGDSVVSMERALGVVTLAIRFLATHPDDGHVFARLARLLSVEVGGFHESIIGRLARRAEAPAQLESWVPSGCVNPSVDDS
jgi:hypothetical protein